LVALLVLEADSLINAVAFIRHRVHAVHSELACWSGLG